VLLVRKLSLIATLVCVAALTAAGFAFGASGARDLFNSHENGDSNPLVSGATYRASLFPIAIRLHPADRLWEGAQFLRTSGMHEGEQRTGAKYAFVQVLHKYAHDAQGKISNWGRGTITFEAGFKATGSVRATMDRLRARLGDFQTVGDVSPVHIAGYSGLRYDGRLQNGNGSYHRFVPFSSSDGSQATTDSRKVETNYGKGEALRILVLSVRGTPLVIFVEGETAPADKFPVFLKVANRFLSTLTFPR
jgi:hypothetical protein